MNVMEFERRLRKLAVREGMSFATLVTLDEAERAVVLATILSGFDPAAVYTERQVNERLKAWLAGVGSMIATDHVSLRRFLVDTKVLARTSDCAEYRAHPGAVAGLSAEFAALDAEAIAAEARRDAGERRAARKDAWLKHAGGAGGAGAG